MGKPIGAATMVRVNIKPTIMMLRPINAATSLPVILRIHSMNSKISRMGQKIKGVCLLELSILLFSSFHQLIRKTSKKVVIFAAAQPGSIPCVYDIEYWNRRNKMNESKRLYRSKNDRMIAGVCAGLASYIEIDPTIVRLLFVLGLFAGGATFWAYLVMMLVVPEEH
jgi:phage shock protein C